MSVRLSRLPSGLSIVTHDMDHLKSAALGVWVGAGSRAEQEEEHGLSHLLEHMAFKGTNTRSAADIAEQIEAVGGELNAATSVEATSYYARVLKEDVPLALDILSDILCNSVFDNGELAREQHVIVQEIGAAFDMPEDHIFDLFTEAAYPAQPLGRTILGTPETVRSASPPMLRAYLDRHYHGPAMVVAAAGAVDHDAHRRARRREARRPRHRAGAAAGAGELPGRRPARGARPHGNADHARLRGPALLLRQLLHRPDPGGDHRRRHVVAPLPGSAREARPLLLDLRLSLELRRHRHLRRARGDRRRRHRAN